MKINFLKKATFSTFLAVTFLAASCSNAPKQADEHNHDDHDHDHVTESVKPIFSDVAINDVYQHYIHLKTALVAHDNDEAASGAEMLEKALINAGNTDLAKSATEIKSANAIEEKRALLSTFSEKFGEYLKQSKLEAGVVYKQFCPMANGNEGGYWLASEKTINNPYYGDKMLKCGSISEEIK
jgi:hypothetical protein